MIYEYHKINPQVPKTVEIDISNLERKSKTLLTNLLLDLSVSWFLNSLWPSEAIWLHKTWSTLVQVMACYLKASSHYLSKYWQTVHVVLWCHQSAFHLNYDNIFSLRWVWKLLILRLQPYLPGANESNFNKKNVKGYTFNRGIWFGIKSTAT